MGEMRRRQQSKLQNRAKQNRIVANMSSSTKNNSTTSTTTADTSDDGATLPPSPPRTKPSTNAAKNNATSLKETYTTRHVIGGREYELTMWPPRWTASRLLKTALMVVTWPVWIPLGTLYMTLQFLSPESFRAKLCGWLLPQGMQAVDQAQTAKRQVLLQHVSGRVLDVGAGSGSYFRYFTKADSVVAVEPVETLHAHLQSAAARFLRDKEELIIVRDLADLDPKQYQFDWIILGNVLCEVPCIPDALQRVNQLLAPGGHVYFSEHLGCPKGTWERCFQDAFNPLWHRGTMGCNCNRDTLFYLQEQQRQGHWHQLGYWTLANVKVAFGPLVLGLAYKKPASKQE